MAGDGALADLTCGGAEGDGRLSKGKVLEELPEVFDVEHYRQCPSLLQALQTLSANRTHFVIPSTDGDGGMREKISKMCRVSVR